MRAEFWRPIAVAIAAISIAVGVVPAAQAATPQQDVASLTNAHRSSAGVPAVIPDPRLDAIAQEQAQAMSDTGRLKHGTRQWFSDRLPAGWTAHGENIAYGYGSANAVMNGWMASRGHKNNILQRSYTRIGVGYVASGNYWVQVFAGYPERPAPIGWFDAATVSGSELTVAGWAIDPESPRLAIPVHVYVTDPDGAQKRHEITAAGQRPDVGALYPSAGSGHGFTTSIALTRAGNYNVCAYAVGTESNTALGCKQAAWNPSRPAGWLDDVSIVLHDSTRTLIASGWALDESTRATITQVHLHVTDPRGSLGIHSLTASMPRPDVGAVFPGAGSDHGFTYSAPISSAGDYTVCAFSIGAPPHGNVSSLLGCRKVRLLPSSPIGVVDSVTADRSARTISVSGWTMDDGARSVSNEAHVYITAPNGVTTGTALRSDRTRVDVGRAFPGAGSAHGFALTTPVSAPGTYRVCVYSIAAPQLAPGNRLLSCPEVTL